MIYFEVAVDAPLDKTLLYSFQSSTIDGEGNGSYVGKRVLVALGRRVVTGYILAVAEECPEDINIKEIICFLDKSPLFHKKDISFFLWVARYYHYPVGEVIKTALPAGINKRSRKIIRLKDPDQLPEWPSQTEEPPEWYTNLCEKKKLSASVSQQVLKSRKDKKLLDALIETDRVVCSQYVSENRIKNKEETCYIPTIKESAGNGTIDAADGDLQNLTQKIQAGGFDKKLKPSEHKTLLLVSRLYIEMGKPVPRRELLKNYKGAAKPLLTLVECGLLEKIQQRVYRNPLGLLPEKSIVPERLTDEQQTICEVLKKDIARSKYSANLLFGVTGGGKTEVYLTLTAYCLSKDKDVLVLVPEIALATQLEAQFIQRFPGVVALLHSGLSDGERYDQWSQAAMGDARIVIGARSAVFAPLKNIGLIIVDEEHDGGFKQDDGLRYNGRDLAVVRAHQQGCTVLLGSATPSVTSYYNCQQGKYTLHTITRRVGKSILPDVSIVDLSQKTSQQKKEILSQEFIDELAKNVERGEQSLVLLNRRGFSSSYLCQDCGASVQCRHCKISLTYHKSKNKLLCHYCGFSLHSNTFCAECNSDKLVPFGVGTERVLEYVREHFPDSVVERLDSDTGRKRNEFFSLLKRMHDQEIDILIGTQMIAKGHHFPNVTFVGVVWADGGLNMPDFKAGERTYQILSQVTGRAGRGDKRGRVLIQTMRKDHFAIQCAQKHAYESFYNTEIKMRRRPVFPPFVRLVHIGISGESEYHVRKTAGEVAMLCRTLNKESDYGCEILGPAPAPLEKINNRYRWQVLIKCRNAVFMDSFLAGIQERRGSCISHGVSLVIDRDPENMM